MEPIKKANAPDHSRVRKFNEVVGIDLGNTSIKMVRLKKSGGTFSLIEADVLEPVDWQTEENAQIHLDKKLHTPYAAVCYAGLDSVIRYVDMPSKLGGRIMENRLRKQLGVSSDYRIKSTTAIQGGAGEDSKVIAVAVPHNDTERIRKVIAGSRPSVASLEISGLAALHTFENTPAAKEAKEAVCYIECGAEVTIVSFFTNGRLALTRKFEYGGSELVARIQESMSLEHKDALGQIFDDSSQLDSAKENPMGPFQKQLTISRHYIERSEQCAIEKVYVSGGLSYSPYWIKQVRETMDCDLEIWNPFENNGLTSYPRGVKGVESMFAPALGAAMALLA